MPGPCQTVGNYEFLGVVDKPKVGVTYKVRNLITGELESLRSLPGASYGDPESQERFLREIRLHARLSHPNIVEFHDAFQLDGRLVMTAEFVEGTTLAESLRRGRLPCDEAVRVICEVLAGLEEAHELGIVHRGITADHVTITPDARVKLGGFGLAKPATDVNLTRHGVAVGDSRYMSPEQVGGMNALDGRSDLYSVGVLLFYALTGRLPFDGDNDFDRMVAHVSSPPPHPSSLNLEIGLDLDRIILKALAKKPDQRFSTAAELRAALEARQPARKTTATECSRVPKTTPKWTRYVAGAVIAIALIGLYFVGLHLVALR
jgi:serine/threonine-protein kinase